VLNQDCISAWLFPRLVQDPFLSRPTHFTIQLSAGRTVLNTTFPISVNFLRIGLFFLSGLNFSFGFFLPLPLDSTCDVRHKEGSLASARNSAPICIIHTGCPKINIPNRRSNNVTGNCARTQALDVLSSSTLGAWGGLVLRHCSTSRRVPGSIPGHWVFFSGHQTVSCALG
jgi:hypothetical protein